MVLDFTPPAEEGQSKVMSLAEAIESFVKPSDVIWVRGGSALISSMESDRGRSTRPFTATRQSLKPAGMTRPFKCLLAVRFEPTKPAPWVTRLFRFTLRFLI